MNRGASIFLNYYRISEFRFKTRVVSDTQIIPDSVLSSSPILTMLELAVQQKSVFKPCSSKVTGCLELFFDLISGGDYSPETPNR